MNHHSTSLNPGWSFTAFACAMLATASIVRAQKTDTAYPASDRETIHMDNYVVSASRIPQDPALVPSSVTLVPLNELASSQVDNLSTALAQIPGVTVATYGGVGGQTNIYVRGAGTAQSLIVVDGVPISSQQTDFFSKSIMGGVSLGGLDRLEILRGPQGTIYGSSAMGGVILMETARGCGPASGSLDTVLGSFGTYGASASVLGGTKSLGYSAALGYGKTDNDRPGNVDRQWNYSTRVEGKVAPSLVLGTTFRGVQGKYHEPGPTLYFSPGIAESDAFLGTAYAEYANDDVFKSRVTLGWQQEDYIWTDQSPWAMNSNYRNTREVLDWQNTWTPGKLVSVVGGIDGEWNHFDATGTTGTLKEKGHGIYVTSDVHPVEPLSLTAGVRYDKFDTAGDATTGRLGAAWRILPTNTKLRATVGTGFNAPGLTERYGDSQWYDPNPALHPEKSTGWDVGVDQSFLKGGLTLETTYFHNAFRDMIVALPEPSGWTYKYQNITRARSEGVELASTVKIVQSLKVRVGGTYLDVYDTTSGAARVPYKPRKSADIDVQWQATAELLLGAGCNYVTDRMRSATNSISDYATARFYASLELEKNVFLKFRIENAFNRDYQEIYGYPALSRGYFGGVEWKF